MVAEDPKRPPKITAAKPKLCKVMTDVKGNHLWVVDEEKLHNRKGVSPLMSVWWSREPRKVVGGATVVQECLIIKQDNASDRSDVLILTHGQAYDLMDALARAVEAP